LAHRPATTRSTGHHPQQPDTTRIDPTPPGAPVDPGKEVNQMAAILPLIPMAAPLVGMTALAAVFVRFFNRPTPPHPPMPYWSVR
jgi:hypothetical protein